MILSTVYVKIHSVNIKDRLISYLDAQQYWNIGHFK